MVGHVRKGVRWRFWAAGMAGLGCVLIGCTREPASESAASGTAKMVTPPARTTDAPVPRSETPAEKPARPIRWTEHVDLGSTDELADFDKRIARPLYEGGEPYKGIATCADFFRSMEKGWEFETNAEMYLYMNSELACEPLRLLHAAQSARVSHVGDFRLDQAVLKALPATLAPPTDDQLNRADDDKQVDRSPSAVWGSVLRGAKLEHPDAHSLRILRDDFETTMILLAWADFNADGFEDVLLWIESQATGGTLRFGSLRVITKTTPDGSWQVIDLTS